MYAGIIGSWDESREEPESSSSEPTRSVDSSTRISSDASSSQASSELVNLQTAPQGDVEVEQIHELEGGVVIEENVVANDTAPPAGGEEWFEQVERAPTTVYYSRVSESLRETILIPTRE